MVRLESAESGSSSYSSWVAVYTVVCVLLPLLGAAAFLPSTLNGDFVYDDKKCVVENRSVSPTLNKEVSSDLRHPPPPFSGQGLRTR